MTNLVELFPDEEVSLLPLTFCFGEAVNCKQDTTIEAQTRYDGEETVSHPEPGGYDTD